MKTQQTKLQKTKETLGADIFRFAVAAVFITMTMAFIMVPYALSFHPGDQVPHAAAAATRHFG